MTTNEDDHRARGRALLIAAMNARLATAKTWAAHLALEDLQLVAKDHYLDVAVQMIGGASDKLNNAA